MTPSKSFTSFLVLANLVLYLSLNCSASSHLSSSPTIASDQIKFWSRNVQNEMPNSILKKLSPLRHEDTHLFTNLIKRNINKFSEDGKLCSLAKLACKPFGNKYPTTGILLSDLKTEVESLSFFRLSVLKKGNLVHLPNMQQSLPDRTFLPPQIASRISLTSVNDIAKLFPRSIVDGTMKETIETTISYCNSKAIEGEMKSCPKSLEEMISFSELALGGKNLISLSSKSLEGSSNATLKIRNIKQYKNDMIVGCHEVFLPFAIYLCHSVSSSSLYQVDLVDPNSGAPVNTMLAICHMDTSSWPKNHPAFQMLKFGPGEGAACHWFTQLDLAWIAADGESI